MAKTITLRIDEAEYEIFKKAASGQKRSISNFIEFAALKYLLYSSTVSDSEMDEILLSEDSIKQGLKDIDEGRIHYIE